MLNSSFSFSGKISRTEYALSLIFVIVTGTILSTLIDKDGLGILALLFIPLFWFLLAQGGKRCHDLKHSGWYQFIPFYGLFMVLKRGEIKLVTQEFEQGKNNPNEEKNINNDSDLEKMTPKEIQKYRENYMNNLKIGLLIILIVLVLISIIIGIISSVKKDNESLPIWAGYINPTSNDQEILNMKNFNRTDGYTTEELDAMEAKVNNSNNMDTVCLNEFNNIKKLRNEYSELSVSIGQGFIVDGVNLNDLRNQIQTGIIDPYNLGVKPNIPFTSVQLETINTNLSKTLDPIINNIKATILSKQAQEKSILIKINTISQNYSFCRSYLASKYGYSF